MVTSTAEENAIRRWICVVSRIRHAKYGLVAHGHLAAAASTVSTTRGFMHRSLLRHASSATACQERLMMRRTEIDSANRLFYNRPFLWEHRLTFIAPAWSVTISSSLMR